MEYKDYYKILGVPRTASQADVKKAFRKLARQHHPDLKPGDKKAEQAFKDANEANEVLSDAAKRRQYDELGANWAQYSRAGAAGGAGSPFAGYNFGQGGGVRYEFRGGDAGEFSDFFRTFFGGAPSGFDAAQARGGGRSRAPAAPSLEDLLSGMGGAGSPTARDHGPLAPAEAEADITLEEAFSGTTRLVDVDGKRLEIKVPAGVDTGSRIKLTGKGGGTGTGARDLLVVPKVRPHPTFTRTGADLTRELRVNLREALLGGEVTVPTLTGRVLLTLPAGTQGGRTFRLTGQGMPRLRGEGRGDLYVRIVVVLPGRLTDEARAAAAAFLDLAEQPDAHAG